MGRRVQQQVGSGAALALSVALQGMQGQLCQLGAVLLSRWDGGALALAAAPLP